MATLAELLAKLPDNTTGQIDAVDLREIVTALWVRSMQWAGFVDTAGSVVNAPAGWTAVREEDGLYTVTHNLGLPANAYSVVVTPMSLEGQSFVVATVTATAANSFTYAIGAVTDGAPTNRYAGFLVGVNA